MIADPLPRAKAAGIPTRTISEPNTIARGPSAWTPPNGVTEIFSWLFIAASFPSVSLVTYPKRLPFDSARFVNDLLFSSF